MVAVTTPSSSSAPDRSAEPVLYGGGSPHRRVRIHHLQQAKAAGDKCRCSRAYDTYAARVFEEAGIPVLLVGDSAGNVVLGHSSTGAGDGRDLCVFTQAVTRSTSRALIVADCPSARTRPPPSRRSPPPCG